MDAKELKARLTDQEITYIIQSLGGEIWFEDDEKLITSTSLCHDGDSPNKLYYYKDSKTFFCQTHCGTTDILAIVSNVKDLNLPQSIQYICTLLGISTMKEGFGADSNEILEDWSFINSFKKNYSKLKESNKSINVLNKNTLNMFQKIYTKEWIDDGITKEVMNEYGILYSTLRQSIIIPHFDINNDLLGIRQRALLEVDIDVFGKYTPFSICGEMYNHPLSVNLYGIHRNKETIKKKKKVMLVESEKGVLQVASYFGVDNNFTLALCGCAKISKIQRKLLLDLGVNEVIIALDRQFETVGDKNYDSWKKHLREKIINPLLPYFNVYVIWDEGSLLGHKDSPTDKGKETLLKLMKNKIYIGE